MAEQQDSLKSPAGSLFKSVQLLKESPLGSGGYGTVCRAQCDQLLCAAKTLNFLAFSGKSGGFAKVFEQECEVLSRLRHPNLVLYLGTWTDPQTNLPVLLMELMDHSLTQFLERAETTLPLHTQVNICHDIAQALSFLHSNNIIHRDLSSNNILMVGDKRAKVTDFSMAKLWEASQHSSQGSLSKRPISDVFLPPGHATEANQKKIDCFSFGVICIHVLTQLFPLAGPQFKIVPVSDPNFPDGIETRATEAERRQELISAIPPDHPLLSMALSCIEDKAENRPSSLELCKDLVEVRKTEGYMESVSLTNTDRLMEDIEKQVLDIQKFTSQLPLEASVRSATRDATPPSQGKPEPSPKGDHVEEKPDKPVENEDRQSEPLQRELQMIQAREQALRSELELKNSKVEQQKADLELMTDTLKERDSQLQQQGREMSQMEKKVKELEQLLAESRQKAAPVIPQANPLTGGPDYLELTGIKLEWVREKRAPISFSRSIECMATTETMIYLIQGGTMYVHNVVTGAWSTFVDVPVIECSLAIVRRKLTVIGGRKEGRFTSRLLSLVETAGKKEWLAIYPPMSIQRASTITVHCQSWLMVAGGEGEAGYLKAIEVFNTDTQVWQTVGNLPEQLVFASATHTGTQLYVMGGWVEKMTPSYAVHTCSLQSLLDSSPPPHDQNSASNEESTATPDDTPWSEITGLPLKGTTCAAAKGRLLSVGGRDIHKPTSAVNVYNPLTKSWEVLSHLSHPRHQCYAAVVDGKLVVMGGWKLNSKQVLAETSVVETALVS